MAEFKKGDRVVMVTGDEWAKPGEVGTIKSIQHGATHSIFVRWDEKGYALWHEVRRLAHEMDCSDPNLLFSLRKKEGGKPWGF